MTTQYKNWRPTTMDSRGLALEERQDWIVCPCMRMRDSDPLEESNFATALKSLGGESETIEVHRFGHWGPGWFEIILVHPSREREVLEIEEVLSDYPILDEHDFSEREQAEADSVWIHCYNTRDRIAYIRKYRNQFDFHGLADMLRCIRGKYFAGYTSELLS